MKETAAKSLLRCESCERKWKRKERWKKGAEWIREAGALESVIEDLHWPRASWWRLVIEATGLGIRFCWCLAGAERVLYLVTPSILASSLPCSLCSTLPPAPPMVICKE